MASDAANKLPVGSLGEVVEAKDVSITNPFGVGSVYANDFGLGLTLTDMRIIFAEVGADVTSNAPSKILKANVVVPLQGAEALAQHILAALAEHKKNFRSLSNDKSTPAKSV